jgi:hypothetical protein
MLEEPGADLRESYARCPRRPRGVLDLVPTAASRSARRRRRDDGPVRGAGCLAHGRSTGRARHADTRDARGPALRAGAGRPRRRSSCGWARRRPTARRAPSAEGRSRPSSTGAARRPRGPLPVPRQRPRGTVRLTRRRRPARASVCEGGGPSRSHRGARRRASRAPPRGSTRAARDGRRRDHPRLFTSSLVALVPACARARAPSLTGASLDGRRDSRPTSGPSAAPRQGRTARRDPVGYARPGRRRSSRARSPA